MPKIRRFVPIDMPKPSAAFIINPLSHTVAKRSSILEKLAQENDVVKFTLDDFSKLSGYVSDIAKAEIKLVFIEGGDGTVQGVLTEILRQQDNFTALPKIVILAGGMTNLIALQIGIKKPSQAKIHEILRAPEQAKSAVLPLINVTYAVGDSYQGFLFSTGAIATATRYTQEHVHTKGIDGSAAVRTTLRHALFGSREQRDLILKSSPLELSANGDTVSGNHILTLATTLPKPMIGFHLFWGKGAGPVRLSHIKAGAKKKIRNVSRFVRKSQSETRIKKFKRDGFQSWNVDTATITHSGPMVLDGEFLPQTDKPVTISATTNFTFLS